MKKNRLLLMLSAVLLGVELFAAPVSIRVFAGEEETSGAAETVSEAADEIASPADMAGVDEVVEEGMVPIFADQLNDGVYTVEADSSSTMFSIEEAVLAVSDGKMTAKMTMGGTGYLYVYPGTPEEAAKADEKEYIPFAEDAQGAHTFTIPVKALDEGVKCSAFSKRKEKWYDRTLVFKSASLPEEAFREIKRTTVEELGLKDGAYQIDAVLSGGSGRTSIASPAKLTVRDGRAELEVIFSSPNYDYMLVKGERYETVNTGGNSTFLIPVEGFDYRMPVAADTTAMSKPHEIEYTILLDSSSLKAQ